MKTALWMLLAATLLIPSLASAAGPADSPGAYSFTADGGLRLTTGALGPTKVTLICHSGEASAQFIWTNSARAVVKVAPRPVNGTLAAYPLDSNGASVAVFEFQTDGPDSIHVDVVTAQKVDTIW